MTLDEINKYLVPACERVLECKWGYVSVADAEKLDDLLGIKAYHDYSYDISREPLAEELRSLYVKLAGPHGKTLLAVIEARREK